MPKTIGPLFSAKASGTYGGLITFSDRGDETIAGVPPIANKRHSPTQDQHRADVHDMTTAWREATEPTRAHWRHCASSLPMSGYSLFWKEWFAQGSTPANPPTPPCPPP